jgi:hypothetical protein
LRGFFDTDGCLTFDKKVGNTNKFKKNFNYYPRLMFTTCSEPLKDGFLELVQKLGFNCKCYSYKSMKENENKKFKLQIVGKDALELWMNLIGSKNPSKISRYLIWKRFGFCPPNTNYNQRINILEEKLKPYLHCGPVV